MPQVPAHRLVFTGKQQVELEAFDLPDPEGSQVRIRARCTLMSTGTENIVFNRNFAPGTHWDNWVRYPFHPGYSSAGVVEAAGPDVKTLHVGDRVVSRARHCSHALLDESLAYPVPAGVPDEQAVWFALAKIALHGALAADYRLGDSVVVIGAGPIGQMTLRWARAAGAAPVIVVDPLPQREAAALAGGASAYLAKGAAEIKDQVMNLNGGLLPNIVVDTTGHAAVFAAALSLAAPGGKVVVLGDVGSPASQSLTSDVIIKGLSIVAAHDGNRLAGWDAARMAALFFRMAQERRFSLDGLISHRFAPSDCMEAYATANRDRASTMGILFEW